MKEAVILGAGTAGTMMANLMAKKLPKGWNITVVDQHKEHYYQPGFLFVPFDIYQPEDVVKTIDEFLPKKANIVRRLLIGLIMRTIKYSCKMAQPSIMTFWSLPQEVGLYQRKLQVWPVRDGTMIFSISIPMKEHASYAKS